MKKAFLDAVNNPELSEFLETMNYQGGFIDVKDSQYDVIRMTADALGLSPEELLK